MSVLTILEVSQKQAFIFSSNKLKDNVVNSEIIARIMSPEFFESSINDENLFSKDKNLVYSGGGHIVLEFETKDDALTFAKKITALIYNKYNGISVFAATMEYNNSLAPGTNLKNLTKTLEKKKAERRSAFHQGTFGVERIDSNTLKPIMKIEDEIKLGNNVNKTDKYLTPKGYKNAYKFESLGGSFIAVVHIDGNAMGKRVERLYELIDGLEWSEYKKKIRLFSESIDKDFKSAYLEMVKNVVKNIETGNLKDLSLQDKVLPVRRIITAGDDICFVAEGRIGIECAVSFIKALNKLKNAVDEEEYSACAGVAIVHQKYPFYKAYELAESLCSNAKKFCAGFSEDSSGKEISAIDWHVEFGEVKDTLDDIRRDYIAKDGGRLEMRPYIINATDGILEKEKIRRYENFRKLVTAISDNNMEYARGKLKSIREVLKEGEESAEYFLKFNKIENITRDSYQGIFTEVDNSKASSGEKLERKIFIETADGERRSILFDAIELSDTFIRLEY